MYAQQIATSIQASSQSLLAIIQYLQSVSNPREALRQNATQFCIALGIPVTQESDQCCEVLEVLLTRVMGMPLYEPTGEDVHKDEYLTPRSTGYEEYHLPNYGGQGLDAPMINDQLGSLIHSPLTSPPVSSSTPIQHSDDVQPASRMMGTITQPVVSAAAALVCESGTSDRQDQSVCDTSPYYPSEEVRTKPTDFNGQHDINYRNERKGHQTESNTQEYKDEPQDEFSSAVLEYNSADLSSREQISQPLSTTGAIQKMDKEVGAKTPESSVAPHDAKTTSEKVSGPPPLALKFDELIENLTFSEKVDFLQGLSSCSSALAATADSLQGCEIKDAEETLTEFKTKVMGFLSQCHPSLFLFFGASIIQSFPYFNNRLSLHATSCRCSGGSNFALACQDNSPPIEDLRRFLFLKLAEALRAAGLVEKRAETTTVVTPSAPTSVPVSSTESSEGEDKKRVVRKSKRLSPAASQLSRESNLDHCPKRQKLSESDPTWEPSGISKSSSEQSLVDSKAVTSISYLVPLLSGLCSSDPTLAIQVSDILNTHVPNGSRRMRVRWPDGEDVKSDLKCALDPSSADRKSALTTPINERDAELLRMPNHIITKSGVILPPADSVLYLSKVVGVVWDKIHNSWVVNYTLLGRRYFQHFPAKKFGFLEGRKSAIELRLAKDREKALVEGTVRGGGRRAQGPTWEGTIPPKRRRRRRKMDDGMVDSEEMNEQTGVGEDDMTDRMGGGGDDENNKDGSVDGNPNDVGGGFESASQSDAGRIMYGDEDGMKASIMLAADLSERPTNSPLSTIHDSPRALSSGTITPSSSFSGQSSTGYTASVSDDKAQSESQQPSLSEDAVELKCRSNGINSDVLHPQTTPNSDSSRMPVLMSLQSSPSRRNQIDNSLLSSQMNTNGNGMRMLNSSTPHLNGVYSPQLQQHLLSQQSAIDGQMLHALHHNVNQNLTSEPMSSDSLSARAVLHHHHQMMQSQYHHLAHLHPSSAQPSQHY